MGGFCTPHPTPITGNEDLINPSIICTCPHCWIMITPLARCPIVDIHWCMLLVLRGYIWGPHTMTSFLPTYITTEKLQSLQDNTTNKLEKKTLVTLIHISFTYSVSIQCSYSYLEINKDFSRTIQEWKYKFPGFFQQFLFDKF